MSGNTIMSFKNNTPRITCGSVFDNEPGRWCSGKPRRSMDDDRCTEDYEFRAVKTGISESEAAVEWKPLGGRIIEVVRKSDGWIG